MQHLAKRKENNLPAEAQKHRSTEAQKHRSTEAQKHRSTAAQKHRNTSLREAQLILTGASSVDECIDQPSALIIKPKRKRRAKRHETFDETRHRTEATRRNFFFLESPQISCWRAGNHMNPLHQAVGEICNRQEKAGNVGRLQSWLDSSCAGPGGLTFGNTRPSRATETSIRSSGDAMYTRSSKVNALCTQSP